MSQAIAKSHTPSLSADILLVTVTKVEAQAVLTIIEDERGDECSRHYIDQKTYYDLGLIGEARVFMVRSEMGAVGAGGALLTVQTGLQVLSPAAVIMVGIAFGISTETQHIGDILVSQQLQEYELQRLGTGSDGKLAIKPRGERVGASPRLLDRFRDGEMYWQGAKVSFGLVLSGQKLIDNLEVRNQLLAHWSEAIGGEMEGAGLCAAANLSKVDWILVKAICDWADGKKHEHKSQRQQEAAQNAANFTIHVIKRGGFSIKSGPLFAKHETRKGTIRTHVQPYNFDEIFQLLSKAFNDYELNLLRSVRFPAVTFTKGMPKNKKIRTLLDYCRHDPTRCEELLRLVRAKDDLLFKRFEPYLRSSSDDPLLVSIALSHTDVKSLLYELTEWKLIHNDVQEILKSLDAPISYLNSYRFKPDPDKLDEAGYQWQESCVHKLKLIPGKWALQYAYSPYLNILQEKKANIDDISRQLMSDISANEFRILYRQLKEFRGILWDILIAADKRIMILIENLRKMAEA